MEDIVDVCWPDLMVFESCHLSLLSIRSRKAADSIRLLSLLVRCYGDGDAVGGPFWLWGLGDPWLRERKLRCTANARSSM